MNLPSKAPSSAHGDARGFSLSVLAFRSVMAELSGAHAKYRADVWEVFEASAPPGDAEALFGHFFAFVRALLATTERPLEWRRTYCAHLCRDEWLAVSMIASAQRSDLAGLLEAASELIGVEALGDALSAVQTLASELARRGLYLCPRAASAPCGKDLCPQRTLH
jgi:hypothetical protein